MYIERYWGNYVGGSDDSLTLLEYLEGKEKEQISLEEIFEETGLNNLSSFRDTDCPLEVPIDGFEAEIHYAITLITDLAALLLECKVNGSVNISELLEDDMDCVMSITATEQEHELINKTLADFIEEPLEYDLCEMVGDEEMLEMSQVCEEIRKELYNC